MQIEAKRELARAIADTSRLRESSWLKGSGHECRGSYGKSYEQAAHDANIDPDLVPIVVAMLVAGYVDFLEWSERMLAEKAIAD